MSFSVFRISRNGRGISLRAKLIIIFVLLSVVPLVIVGVTSYRASHNAIKTVSVDSFSQVVDQLNKSISLLLRDSEKFLSIGSSDAAIEFLRFSDNPELRYSNAMRVINQFKMYRDIFKFDEMIKGIYIIGLDGYNISESRGVYRLKKEIESIELVQQILSDRDKIHTISNHIIDYSDQIMYSDVISIGRVIKKPVTYEILG